MSRTTRLLIAGIGLGALFAIAACSEPESDTGDPNANPPTSSAASEETELSIGFFGFAKANSFTQAHYDGVVEYAESHNATATFVDSNFDPVAQASQLQDAITSKQFDLIILQPIDGTAMVNPVTQAVDAGLPVVVVTAPVGGDFSTVEPQVPGIISVVHPTTVNGEGLGQLGLDACAAAQADPCLVGYLQGFENFPLDAARTESAVTTLEAGGAEVISNLIGGYTPDTGRAAVQNLLQAHPDVNVIIGSSQAIIGAAPLVAGTSIQLVGNGGSSQAVEAVMAGDWYGTYYIPATAAGAKAAELGLEKARGGTVAEATDICDLTEFACLGTRETLAGTTADYSD